MAIPTERLTQSPWALYWLGLSRMQTNPALARQDLTHANDLFLRNKDSVGKLLSAAAIIRSYHFEYSTFEAMDHWMEQIQTELTDLPVSLNATHELAIHSAAQSLPKVSENAASSRADSASPS